MKTIFCTLFFTLISSISVLTAQSVSIQDVWRSIDRQDVDQYQANRHSSDTSRHFQITLYVDFGSRYLQSVEARNLINEQKIVSVDLYYSAYPRGLNHDVLNRGRIEELSKALPQVLDDANIKWRLYRQTACRNAREARQLFHGFVITVEPHAGITLLQEAMSYFEKIETGESVDTQFTDFVVSDVFDRNDWVNMLVVTDLTGSMSPYAAQLILWLKLNAIEDRIKQYVFFNDGNTLPDDRKEIGHTGGLYEIRSKDYSVIESLALRCMRSGHGGDGQENDLEAVLHGVSICEDCEHLILIADNFSPVRDMALLEQIKKPVKIILCGVSEETGINVEYLNIARSTGGSIHLMEQDLYNLIELNEGESIKIGGRTYIVDKDGFREERRI